MRATSEIMDSGITTSKTFRSVASYRINFMRWGRFAAEATWATSNANNRTEKRLRLKYGWNLRKFRFEASYTYNVTEDDKTDAITDQSFFVSATRVWGRSFRRLW